MRFKLTLEYDGSNFSGWQKQKNAKSIQETLSTAIRQALEDNRLGTFIDLQGSGRTDAGVHAYGQVAHLDCQTRAKAYVLHDLVNDILPPSINILAFETAEPRFHARHWAKSRQYLYRISKRRNVFEKKHVCWIKEDLDLDKMRTALKAVIGMHDFASFSSKPSKEKSTQVLITSAELIEQDDLILIRLEGSHFLWNMVRNLVGILIEVGKGTLSPDMMQKALDEFQPELTKYRAPASGLFLEKVNYEAKQPKQA